MASLNHLGRDLLKDTRFNFQEVYNYALNDGKWTLVYSMGIVLFVYQALLAIYRGTRIEHTLQLYSF
jgi:hypothetical protein